MTRLSPGQSVVEALRSEGVNYVFGIVGGTFLEILDALYDAEDIKFVSTRHEQGAAFMADGFARASGKPAVCLATNGPGATNLVSGVYAAYTGHSPVIAMSGAPARDVVYRDAFQEADHVSLFRPVTKQALTVNASNRIPELFRHAFRTAMTGKKGPVFIDIPRDLLDGSPIEHPDAQPPSYRVHQRLPADPELVARAASLLSSAERPVIIAGGGVIQSGASETVVQLAELLGAPMITSYGRNDAVPNAHPQYVGPLGRAGAAEAGQACARADVILAAGTRLSNFTSFYDNRYISADAKIIQIEIDERELGRNYPVSVGIQADADAALTSILEALQATGSQPDRGAWAAEGADLRARRRARLDDEATWTGSPLKPQRVYGELRKALPEEAIMVLDAGACPAFGYDRLDFHRPGTLITPLDFGGLGFAFPEALGAKLGRPDAPVVAIHGDGGFLFNVQELETAVREGIAVVTIVMNNNLWGSEAAYQQALYPGREIGAHITNPRFDKLAELFGARGYFVDRAEDVGDVVLEAIGSGQPAVIEIPVDPDELPRPARLVESGR